MFLAILDYQDYAMFYMNGMLIYIVFILEKPATAIVLDHHDAIKYINVNDYCPSIKGCPHGTHLLCVKNPNIVGWFGQNCHSPVNITMTSTLADRILKIFNGMRKKIALGVEKGRNGQPLPRGYGLFKLTWDSELSTFAQIWANQCELGGSAEVCRSTHRFPKPGQLAFLKRMTFPSWELEIHDDKVKPTLDNKVISRNVTRAVLWILKQWYFYKSKVDPEDVYATPVQNYDALMYLSVVSDRLTHIGCGVSHFVEYAYSGLKMQQVFNTVFLVCNLSRMQTLSTRAYQLKKPNFNNKSKCGCPSEAEEEEDSCLCYFSRSECPDGVCKPYVVLLPIVTVENPPQRKIDELLNLTSKENLERRIDPPLPDSAQVTWKPAQVTHKYVERTKKTSGQLYNRQTNLRGLQLPGTKDRNDNKNRTIPPHNTVDFLPKNRIRVSKKSVFSDVSTFEIPSRRPKQLRINPEPRQHRPNDVFQIKRDVPPRKNFGEIKRILDNYMQKRKRINEPTKLEETLDTMKYRLRSKTSDTIRNVPQKFTYPNITLRRHGQYNIKTAISDVDDNEASTSRSNNEEQFQSNNYDEYSDVEVLDVLDHLEKRLNKLNLNERERNIFNEKINKIYINLSKPKSPIEPAREHKSYKQYDIEKSRYINNPVKQYEEQNEETFKSPQIRTQGFSQMRPTKGFVKPRKKNFSQNPMSYPNSSNSYERTKNFKARDYLQNKFNTVRKNNLMPERDRFKQDQTREIRPMLRNRARVQFRKSTQQWMKDPIYVPGRARALHGY